MTTTNQFLQFCPTDTGTNLLSEAEYIASTDRTTGNKPGVASSKLVNKALRQSSFITSQMAQYLCNQLGTDSLDDADTAKLLSQFNALFSYQVPKITSYTSGGSSGTHYQTFIFMIATGSATAGAVYTNNTFSFTVVSTVSAGLILKATGTGAPAPSGILTKSSGTGDAIITFYAVRAPLYLVVSMTGGGGGGGGSALSSAADGGSGVDGGDSTFGTSLLIAGGGKGAVWTNSFVGGGTATINSPAISLGSATGQQGGGYQSNVPTVSSYAPGGAGGSSGPFSGGAPQSSSNSVGVGASTQGGGGSGGNTSSIANCYSGAGGGGAAYVKAMIYPTPGQSFAYSVANTAAGGAAGTNGYHGGIGNIGIIIVEEHYQ